MKAKLDSLSLLVGAFAGATLVLCIAAQSTPTSPTPSTSQTTPKSNTAPTSETKPTPEAKPSSTTPEQVTGIGGVFFKAKDPKAMLAWYRANLGFPARGSYTDFKWREKDQPDHIGHTAWRIFPTNTTYFGQATGSLMINYRVANLDRMLDQLRKNGTTVEKIENYDYGRFAWITDPEGNRIELWEPKAK